MENENKIFYVTLANENAKVEFLFNADGDVLEKPTKTI